MTTHAANESTLYDGEAEHLLNADMLDHRVSLLPGDDTPITARERVRILWGQDMLRDVVDGRYRAVVCGVNDADNSHGIVAQIVDLIRTSQWTVDTVTNYAKMFQQSVATHAGRDSEPYVLKYDLDSVLVLALLRPKGQDHFTPDDLRRGFETVTSMLEHRIDRRPAATVSFCGARSNRLLDPATGREPSFERVLGIMHEAGFRGDVYPSPAMWDKASAGVFATYPFPAGFARMREGSS
ncbi:MAG: hypothetical protein AAFR38_13740 [Planctomycetota bacterium]